jgi:acetoin utilization protein AcuB
MKVKQRMTPGPVTATPKTTHREAVELMEKRHVRRLPVLDSDGRLVGMVSRSDLLSTAPSPATTLSVYEIYTLLDRLTLDQIMVSPVLAVDENCSLAGAAGFMIARGVGCLPVMRGQELVGIITETDIFKALVEVLGGGEPGMRIDLEVPDEPGVLARITQAFAEAGADIVSLTTFRGEESTRGVISIKERGGDETRLLPALEALEGVEIVEFRPAGQDVLLSFGK